MGLKCSCPAGAHLSDLSIPACTEAFGQLQKVGFQRIYKTVSGTTSRNVVAKTGGAAIAASDFSSLLSASDDTKMIVSPVIENPVTTPGEAITFGGGNQTAGGVSRIIGRNATSVTGVMYDMPQSVVKTLKDYQCESMGVWLVDEYGNIGCLAETVTSGGSTTTNYYPIPVQGFFVGDKKLGGLEEPDSNAVQWNFLPNWSDNFVILAQKDFAGGFNPLTDWVNVASGN